MSWFSNKKGNTQNSFNKPEEMSPLESVTHLCASIQIADGRVDFEERQSWLNLLEKLFPEYLESRANRFLSEAFEILKKKNISEKNKYLIEVLKRIKKLLKREQLEILGSAISELIEADGIVMTSELDISNLITSELKISIKINKEL